MNTFGQFLRLTTFGESHGPAIGGILDGMPPRIHVDKDKVDAMLARRRPGAGGACSSRKESDRIRILSGLTPDGFTLGTPIGFMIANQDARPSDYSDSAGLFRPNHADFTYQQKYGIAASSGGGRSSARETANWVAAGAIALSILNPEGISTSAWISGIGPWKADDIYSGQSDRETIGRIAEEARSEGDSVGALVSCRIKGGPAGLGEPVADKLQSRLAAAMMSINAAKSFEYGLGREAAGAYGRETADIPVPDEDTTGGITFATNFSGGIQGGISNGEDIYFSVAFKPTPTLMQPMPTVDRKGRPATLLPRGRHDACVGLRAVPVVEAMASLVIADMLLASRLPLKAQCR